MTTDQHTHNSLISDRVSVVNRTAAQMREEKQNFMMFHPFCITIVSPAHETFQ